MYETKSQNPLITKTNRDAQSESDMSQNFAFNTKTLEGAEDESKMPRASVADDMEKKRFSAIDIPDPLATSKVQVPKLNIGDADGDLSRRNKEPGTTKHGKR